MQTQKNLGSSKNSVFEIRAIRENTRFIARCPSTLVFFYDILVLYTQAKIILRKGLTNCSDKGICS